MSSMSDHFHNKPLRPPLGNKDFMTVDKVDAELTGLLNSQKEEVKRNDADRSRWFQVRAERKAEYIAAKAQKAKRPRRTSVDDEKTSWDSLASGSEKLRVPKLPSFVKLRANAATEKDAEVAVQPSSVTKKLDAHVSQEHMSAGSGSTKPEMHAIVSYDSDEESSSEESSSNNDNEDNNAHTCSDTSRARAEDIVPVTKDSCQSVVEKPRKDGSPGNGDIQCGDLAS
eukprot:TRINITY_DN15637_c0_g1_i1.p1 TRINITY_DN15637_c0_g1~~TRINITY_DN15637_c0_g1_i1.p1  ORF type:complete len:227 (-),score=31.63 TRINITY_DN15637_c0_g1_i1:409-1089(-)